VGSRSKINLAYISGFLDGDGSLMLQFKKRKDGISKIRFMSTICFYQDTRHEKNLYWIRDILGKGFKITDEAFSEISNFIKTKYYANIAPNKLGKLIIRESWFEEFDLNSDIQMNIGSEAMINSLASPNNASPDQIKIIKEVKKQIASFPFQRNLHLFQKALHFLEVSHFLIVS
jgi:hypothetical protein